MPVADYNTNPALNTSISSVDLSEGCSAQGFNNAIRQMMADIRAWTDAYAVSYPIAIDKGGTAATVPSVAFSQIAISGGAIGADTTINGKFTRLGKGVHPYWNSASATGGQMFLQAVGADPTANPFDIVFEY